MTKQLLTAVAVFALAAPALAAAQDRNDEHHDRGQHAHSAPAAHSQAAPAARPQAQGRWQGAPTSGWQGRSQATMPTPQTNAASGAQWAGRSHGGYTGGQTSGQWAGRPQGGSTTTAPATRPQGQWAGRESGQWAGRQQNGQWSGRQQNGQWSGRQQNGQWSGHSERGQWSGRAQAGDHRNWNGGEHRWARGEGRRFSYAGRNFFRFRADPYRWPSGFGYRHWGLHQILPPVFLADDYYLNDYYDFGLADPPYGAEWIRVGDDALLVSLDTGEVLDEVPGVFYY